MARSDKNDRDDDLDIVLEPAEQVSEEEPLYPAVDVSDEETASGE